MLSKASSFIKISYIAEEDPLHIIQGPMTFHYDITVLQQSVHEKH